MMHTATSIKPKRRLLPMRRLDGLSEPVALPPSSSRVSFVNFTTSRNVSSTKWTGRKLVEAALAPAPLSRAPHRAHGHRPLALHGVDPPIQVVSRAGRAASVSRRGCAKHIANIEQRGGEHGRTS